MPKRTKKSPKFMVFGEPDRESTVWRVRSGERRFYVLAKSFSSALVIAMEFLGATTPDDLSKPFEMENEATQMRNNAIVVNPYLSTILVELG